MKLNKRQRLKTVVAVGYCLAWYFSNGFDWGIAFYSDLNEDEMIAWFLLIVPLALLFFGEIKRWVAAGGE
jgi:hypothetical protein